MCRTTHHPLVEVKNGCLFIWKREEFVQVGGYVTGTFQTSVLQPRICCNVLLPHNVQDHASVFRTQQGFHIVKSRQHFIYLHMPHDDPIAISHTPPAYSNSKNPTASYHLGYWLWTGMGQGSGEKPARVSAEFATLPHIKLAPKNYRQVCFDLAEVEGISKLYWLVCRSGL